jgi:hypothetical protein
MSDGHVPREAMNWLKVKLEKLRKKKVGCFLAPAMEWYMPST